MEYVKNGKKYYDVLLSWEDAEKIWQKHLTVIDFKNRPIDKQNVKQFCQIIEAGEWEPGMGSIEISPRGAVVDGQHRILAAIETKSTIRVMITFEASEKMLPKMDRGGKRRSIGESLAMLGIAEGNYIGAGARWLMTYLKKNITTAANNRDFVSVEDIGKLYYHYQKYFNEGKIFYKRQNMKRMPSSLCIAFFVIFASINHEKACEFYTKLCEGTGLEKGDPVYALRNMLEKNTDKRTFTRSYNAAVGSILSWNAFMEGKKKMILQQSQVKDDPSIYGFSKQMFLAGIE